MTVAMTAQTELPRTDEPVAVVARSRQRLTVAVASLGFFLITLDILIVNLALPDMSRDLGAGTQALQWVIDGYTLPFAALLLFAGNLSDRIGAKLAFGWGIALFAVASAACGLAPSIGLLIGARFGQGASAAIMLPASMALIRDAFPDSAERARALGVWAVGGAVAGGIGPLVGGALATVDWRLVFAINVPVCVVIVVLFRAIAPSSPRPAPFDWAGQVASLIAITALVWGLIEGGAVGFTAAFVVAALVVAAVALAAFITIQGRVQHPMMPLPLLHPSGMRIALGVGLAFMVGWFGTVFLVSLYLQQELHLTPFAAGLTFLPSAVVSIFGNVFSGRISNRFGPRVPIAGGLASMALGLFVLATATRLDSPVLVAALVLLIGTGGSVAMPAATAVVLDSAPPAQAGTASAVFNTFRQVGGAVAIAVFGALVAGPGGFVPGMQLSLIIAATIVITMALASLRIRARTAR
jgi:DHA2 family methylenomycin A resistance protein-like MFS transporter